MMSGVSSLSDQILDLYDPSEHPAEIVNSEIRAEVAATESLLVSIKIDGSVDLLLRGLGTSLANGVGDPNITLYDSDSNAVLQNDDWGAGSAASSITALGMSPSESYEAADLITLPEGNYSLVVSDFNQDAGVVGLDMINLGSKCIWKN